MSSTDFSRAPIRSRQAARRICGKSSKTVRSTAEHHVRKPPQNKVLYFLFDDFGLYYSHLK